jgi:hypothetical protein
MCLNKMIPAVVWLWIYVCSPGLTNTVTAIKNAQMAESPLLLMGGAAATLLKVWFVKIYWLKKQIENPLWLYAATLYQCVEYLKKYL